MADTISVVAALIEKDGLLLAAKRADKDPAGPAWEFPGGKVEVGEDLEDALKREIKEELGATLQTMWLLDTKRSPEEDGTCFEINYFVCTLTDESEPVAKRGVHSELCWIDAPGLLQLEWLPSDHEVALSLGQAWEEVFSTNRL